MPFDAAIPLSPSPPPADSDAVRVLLATRRLVRVGWCQGAWAKCGWLTVDAHSPLAHRWCLVGAFSRAAMTVPDYPAQARFMARYRAEQLFVAAIGVPGMLIELWNDRPGRTKRQVLEMLDRAIALGRAATMPVLAHQSQGNVYQFPAVAR
jgi:hypothetical protein